MDADPTLTRRRSLDWERCTVHDACIAAAAGEWDPGESMDRDAALRILALRDQVHPDDVWAYTHADPGLAEAARAVNRDHYGHPSWSGTVEGKGTLTVLDFRPALAELGCPPTDPARP